MDRQQALRKIQACLRMAGSSNATEAATALRQARALMEKYDLNEADVAASEIGNAESATGYRGGMVPQSLVALASIVADGYRCGLVIQCKTVSSIGFAHGMRGKTVVLFYGAGADPEVAAYAFTVLRRQLARDKAKHTSRIRKQANKERRGEAFALGWVTALAHLFPAAELPEGRQAEVNAAIKQNSGELKTSSGKVISKGRAGADDRWVGYQAGANAQLHQGVSEGQKKLEAH